jgi:hypothetical protein
MVPQRQRLRASMTLIEWMRPLQCWAAMHFWRGEIYAVIAALETGKGRRGQVPRREQAARIAMIVWRVAGCAAPGWTKGQQKAETPVLLLCGQARRLSRCPLRISPTLTLCFGDSQPPCFAHALLCRCLGRCRLFGCGGGLRSSLLLCIRDERLARSLQCCQCLIYCCDEFCLCHSL